MLVAVGSNYACALVAGGGVECWGNNANGRLGNGSTTSGSVPVPVFGLSSGVTAVSAGMVSACALLAGGSVECWGANTSGQLGNGTTTDSSVPVAVVGLSSGVTAVSVGYDFACAVTASGGVECWGDNANGQLGNGTTTNSSVPVPTLGLSSGATAVSLGYDVGCALLASGGVQCWGDDIEGELGNGSITSSTVPVAVSGLSSGVSAVSVGSESACALLAGGGVECWGSNNYGEIGNASELSGSSVPIAVSGLAGPVTSVSVGSDFACALLAGGGVECWGSNNYGEIGNGTGGGGVVSVPTPTPVSSLTSGAAAVSAGGSFACALLANGGIECWGSYGLTGLTPNSLVPVPVSGF